ncbi:MAG: hypothetical protein ATN31_06810 [Candidatus Epulonipiscioides saccharophilum]|nr:MAG: hypothetical protein ATN31_06810 [Epulopiscium sp. AS2M-Bin001]
MKKYFVFISVALICVGCLYLYNNNKNAFTSNEYYIYYFDTAKNTLSSNPVEIDPMLSREKTVFSLIEALYQKLDANFMTKLSTIPTTLIINNGIAQIDFTELFESLSIQEQMLVRVALVYTLTDLNFISGVSMTVNQNPLSTAHSIDVGIMDRSNIILNAMNPNPSTNYQTLKLYFFDPESNKLVLEKRGVEVNKDIPIENYIIEELIKGPMSNNLLATLPSNTVINYIITKDGVCQIDLSSSQFKDISANDYESIMLNSIVNSLTEVYYIQKVGLLVDGKREPSALGDIDLNLLFERNEALLEKD